MKSSKSGLASGNTKGPKPAPAKVGAKPKIAKVSKIKDKSKAISKQTGKS